MSSLLFFALITGTTPETIITLTDVSFPTPCLLFFQAAEFFLQSFHQQGLDCLFGEKSRSNHLSV